MTPAAADTKLDAHVLKISGVVVLGAIMAILDITVVSVALRTFMDVFDTSYATAGWTMTAYTLALATVIPLSGWASDRFGTKRLYMMAIVLFAAGSALCATAGSIGQLIAYRAIQGLGGGMLMPVGMTIMTRAAGPERVGRVMAVLGVPMLIGPIAGPILSGWLIQIASWHWIFLINVPIGMAALAYSHWALPKDEPSAAQPFDLLGMVLLSPGLVLLLFGVSSIPAEGTIVSTRVLLTFSAGAVLIALFVRHAFRPEYPLIDLRLFKDKQLSLAVIGMFLFGISFFGAMLLLPSYFQQVRGEDTLHAGLLLAPQGLGAMLTMPIAGRLADKLPIGRIVIPGLVVCCIGVGWLTQVGAHTSYVSVLGALFVLGLGMGATMMPLFTAGLQTLTGPTIARGSTLLNIVQQVASSCGAAIMTVLLTDRLKGVTTPDGAANAFSFTFTVAAILVAVVLIPAVLLPRRSVNVQPAPTVAAKL